MHAHKRGSASTVWVAARTLLLFTAVLGIGYTLALTGLGQQVFPVQADGSLQQNADGNTVGSALIGQSFTNADGEPLPEYFQSRPSAAGDGYDSGKSSGSNLGPENPDLVTAIEDRKNAISELEGVPEAAIPADAVTASSSGLDPDISPAYALLQVDRVAEARGMTSAELRDLVVSHTQTRDLGFLGEPRVNVLAINLELNGMED